MGEVPCSSQPTAPTCVVWSWRLPNTRQRLSFSFPELWYNLLDFNSTKNCQHLTNWTRWNKRDQNKLKHAYLDPMLSFRLHFPCFSASLGHKAMFSLEDILQIAHIICPCCVFFSPPWLERAKCSSILYCSIKITQPRAQGFSWLEPIRKKKNTNQFLRHFIGCFSSRATSET